jgi:aminopeptidase N
MKRALAAGLTLVVLVALSGGAARLRADMYPRQPGVDAFHYAFTITFDDTKPEINAEAAVDLLFTTSSVSSVWFDLATPAAGKGMTVSKVTGTGVASHTHADNRLTIRLSAAPAAGEHRIFRVSYSGVPAKGLMIGNNKHTEWSAFSQNWPNLAHQWLPMIDHPGDKATSEFIVTAPAKYQVVANGLLQEETDLGDGRRTTHWKQSVPIASWLNALGVEQFYVHHAGRVRNVELSTWVAHQDKDAGPVYFEEPARQALEFYSDYVGPYAYEKLANVAAAGVSGGMEHASVIFYGERGIRPQPAFGLVSHEIAHQWFGNAVTESDWNDVWLSESFATYFTHLCEEHYLGRAVMVAGLKRDITTVLNTEKRLPDTPVIHRNLSDMTKVLSSLVYQKGGWVLHMLRGRIGSDAFRTGIRDYYRRFMNGNATTADFRAAMERASGEDLSWFFAQWLTRPGVPKIDGSWRYDAAAKQIEVTLSQALPSGGPFRLPIEIGVIATAGAAPRIEKVELSTASNVFRIPADAAPSSVVLDPNTWLLYEAGTFAQASDSILLHPESPEFTRPAPDRSLITLTTTKGDVVIEVTRAWAPRSADRFYNLARLGYYNDARLHRVVGDSWAQFGINGTPAIAKAWRAAEFANDPFIAANSNVRGTVAFAFKDQKALTTQVFVNLRDNSATHDKEPFVPFGRVVSGMDIVDTWNKEYGDRSGGGIRAGNQGPLFDGGNAYIDATYPRLDSIIKVSIK